MRLTTRDMCMLAHAAREMGVVFLDKAAKLRLTEVTDLDLSLAALSQSRGEDYITLADKLDNTVAKG